MKADSGQFQDGCNQPAALTVQSSQYASRQPVQGHADAQGNWHSRRYVWQCPAIWSAGCLRFVRARRWLGRSRTQPTQPAQPSYGQPMYGPERIAQSAQTPYDQQPAQLARSPHTISANLRAASLLSGGPTAAGLRLRAEVEDRRRPSWPVPRHPRHTQLLSRATPARPWPSYSRP